MQNMEIRKPIIIFSIVAAIGIVGYFFLQDNKTGSPIVPVEQNEVFDQTDENYASDLVSKPDSWNTYSYENFQVAFPDKPRITTDSDGELVSTTYAALGEDSAGYFLTVTALPNDLHVTEPNAFLENAVARTVQSVGGELAGAIDTQNIVGHNSIDFVVNIPDGPRTYMGRNVLEGNNVYEMRVVYLSSKSAEFRGFVDSLKFNSKSN
jgi:hypothetical protein